MFIDSFGSKGLQSVVLFCIQSNPKRRFSNEEFHKILNESDAYRLMLHTNENRHIHYLLWDNMRRYQNQQEKFETCLSSVQPFSELQMHNAFDMMNIGIRHYKDIEKLRKIK